jgi:hypothetical protein
MASLYNPFQYDQQKQMQEFIKRQQAEIEAAKQAALYGKGLTVGIPMGGTSTTYAAGTKTITFAKYKSPTITTVNEEVGPEKKKREPRKNTPLADRLKKLNVKL